MGLGIGQVIGTTFADVGADLAFAVAGISLFGVVVLALLINYSIINPRMTDMAKGAAVKLVLSAAVAGAAGIASKALGAIAAKGGTP